MRTYLLLALLVFCTSVAHAQDQLIKRNGEELTVKVMEITPAEVKFHRTDNPDGPLISVFNAVPVYALAPAKAAPAGRTVLPGEIPIVNNRAPNDAIFDEPIHLDGPRVGFTVVSSGVVDKAHDRGIDINPFLTQFGWQFETRLFRLPNGVSGVVELVPLVGGLEQGHFIPSVSGLLGVRGAKGFEFGLGPNLTPLGASIVLAVGTSIQSNGINFPINLAVVPGKEGMRVSLLVGFNTRHR